MKSFKVKLIFENNIEEYQVIQAETIKKANQICEQICLDNKKLVERIESLNVYTTRIIKKCDICNIDWREELLSCLKIEDLKNDI